MLFEVQFYGLYARDNHIERRKLTRDLSKFTRIFEGCFSFTLENNKIMFTENADMHAKIAPL